jgi:hypothetical protein
MLEVWRYKNYFYVLTKLLNYCRMTKGIVDNEENDKRPDFLLHSILTVHLQIDIWYSITSRPVTHLFVFEQKCTP